MTKKMKQFNSLKKTTRVDFATYFGVIAAFVIVTVLQSNGSLKRSVIGLLVPICCYMSMAVSLNLTVGILGELSLGHAGFMSVGAFSGIVVSQSLAGLIPNGPVRLALSMFIGALLAALVGLLIGTPVLRLQGDYLAIVTLAFGEIIKELINCLIIGCDEKGLHFVFNLSGNKTVDDLGLSANGTAIIKGAQGATGTATIASFTAGFILIMVTLVVVLNLVRSRSGRAIMALRDNRIAAAEKLLFSRLDVLDLNTAVNEAGDLVAAIHGDLGCRQLLHHNYASHELLLEDEVGKHFDYADLVAAFQQLQGRLNAHLSAAANDYIAVDFSLIDEDVLAGLCLLYAGDRRNERGRTGGKKDIVGFDHSEVFLGHGRTELNVNIVHTAKLNLEKLRNML